MQRSPWIYMKWQAPHPTLQQRLLKAYRGFLPIGISSQALFAEALSQALSTEMEISDAVKAAAETCRSARFKSSLLQMAVHCRQGHSLAISLAKTGIWTSKRFLATFEAGRTRRSVAEELAMFSRSQNPNVADRLARSLGRPRETTQFALALSRLLTDHRLTIQLIADASNLAAGRKSRFDRVIEDVIEDMRSGSGLSEALSRQASFFDPFFCKVIAASSGRDILRQSLARLAGELARPEASRSVKSAQIEPGALLK